jgi:hypothetical protein
LARSRNLSRTKIYPNGPGTPAYRFTRIMDELEKRWPDPSPHSAQAPEGRLLRMIDDERVKNLFEKERLRSALQNAIIALDDWTNTYASEFCDEERVKEAHDRIAEYGTIGYIASVVKQCRDALENKEISNNE